MKKQRPVEDSAVVWRREAVLFARHLIGADPESEAVELYVKYCDGWSFKDELRREAQPVLSFFRNHPWSIGLLDAGCGLLRPRHPFRERLLAMLAILEASPVYTRNFLPDRRGSRFPMLGILSCGLVAGLRTCVGIPLLLMVERRWLG